MILERRKIHFYSAIALAIILPIVFIWGTVARPFYNIRNQSLPPHWQSPEMKLLGAPIQSQILTNTQLAAAINSSDFPKVLDSEILLNVALEIAVRNNNSNSFSNSLVITPKSILKFPDPLLYWQPNQETPTEIDDSMILLGALPGKASNIYKKPRYVFNLPPQALDQNGSLVLYSQGYNAIAGVFPLCLQNIEQPFVCQEN
ncbi:MAG: hypothetical protein AAGA80_10990 [Cyanobacteria bacterium P01_F01_bin.143]